MPSCAHRACIGNSLTNCVEHKAWSTVRKFQTTVGQGFIYNMGHDITNIKLNYYVLERRLVELLALVADLSGQSPPDSRYHHNPVNVFSLDGFNTSIDSTQFNISKV